VTRIFVISLLFFTFEARAAQISQYIEIARTRLYKGGADESDLKVQPVLYQPAKKKKTINLDPQDSGF
jgi:hypothetical protein